MNTIPTVTKNLLIINAVSYTHLVSNIKENIVRTKADVTGSISDEQTIGMAFAMDNTCLLYTSQTSNLTRRSMQPMIH